MTVLVEIRAAEGGDDAKLLVGEQFAVYLKAADRHGVKISVHEGRPGLLVFEAQGSAAAELFGSEAGGHRWQRVPPTERRGRTHTSTVTVAVFPVSAKQEKEIREEDIEWSATRGSGPGGQHRNVTSSAIQMRHVPTGITVRIENERSQGQNRATARRVLAARVAAIEQQARAASAAADRRRQVGTGMRGDKIRTVRMQDGRVTDHRTGQKTTLSRYQAGHLEDLRVSAYTGTPQ